jgi:hypothetical protein
MDLRLAEASYSMYQSERPDPAMSTVDWQALFVAGHHIVNGGQALRAEREPCSFFVLTRADQVAAASTALAERVRGRVSTAPPPAVPPVPDGVLDGPLAADADVLVWLDGVAGDLDRVPSRPATPR